MNRKIQDSDALFIVARYKRDDHAFSARQEAEKYDVTVVTIYNVLNKAGVKMRRGRKPLLAPPPAQPLISPDAHRVAPGDLTREPPPVPTKPYPDPYAQFTPKPRSPPKPPTGILRKGPPVIRPNAR